MKLGPRDDCRHCGQRIMLCRTRDGKWIPFDLETVPAAEDVVDGYLPIRYQPDAVVLIPITDAAPRYLRSVRWVARRHRCGPFFHALAAERQARVERRERVDSIGDTLATIFRPETRTDERDSTP